MTAFFQAGRGCRICATECNVARNLSDESWLANRSLFEDRTGPPSHFALSWASFARKWLAIRSSLAYQASEGWWT